MEWLKGNWELVVACMIGFNLLMTGLHAALEKVKDLTESKWDNQLADYLAKFLGFLQKIIDLIMANRANKPKVQEQSDAKV